MHAWKPFSSFSLILSPLAEHTCCVSLPPLTLDEALGVSGSGSQWIRTRQIQIKSRNTQPKDLSLQTIRLNQYKTHRIGAERRTLQIAAPVGHHHSAITKLYGIFSARLECVGNIVCVL